MKLKSPKLTTHEKSNRSTKQLNKLIKQHNDCSWQKWTTARWLKHRTTDHSQGGPAPFIRVGPAWLVDWWNESANRWNLRNKTTKRKRKNRKYKGHTNTNKECDRLLKLRRGNSYSYNERELTSKIRVIRKRAYSYCVGAPYLKFA